MRLGWTRRGCTYRAFRYCTAGTGENTATWTFANVSPTAQYQIYATWSAAGNRATNAPYTISDGGNLLATIDMNQQFAPGDATIDGQNWASLGVFTAASGTLVIGLSDNADGIVDADAIRIQQIEQVSPAPVSLIPPTQPIPRSAAAGEAIATRPTMGAVSATARPAPARTPPHGPSRGSALRRNTRSMPPGRLPETARATRPIRFPMAALRWPPST